MAMSCTLRLPPSPNAHEEPVSLARIRSVYKAPNAHGKSFHHLTNSLSFSLSLSVPSNLHGTTPFFSLLFCNDANVNPPPSEHQPLSSLPAPNAYVSLAPLTRTHHASAHHRRSHHAACCCCSHSRIHEATRPASGHETSTPSQRAFSKRAPLVARFHKRKCSAVG
ncbi:hypothetical protein EUGRSUZ_J02004 [Eucalyptus grandis]|uniref:Uncharacterized protein n=2 Tax=Eucalyptus grandis TaxID=71139 RepID=A0ACC3J7F6_EUCGR|nr:hypothetical protein EUGRSUZ_J02004 [Eucalyptus grandis]